MNEILNKTLADQLDIFRPNCSSNDIFLRLKSSHCTMKTYRSFLNNVIPFQKEPLQEHTKHLFVFLSTCVYTKTKTIIFYKFARSHQKTSKFEKLCFFTIFVVIRGTFLRNCKCLFKNAYWITERTVLEVRSAQKVYEKYINI